MDEILHTIPKRIERSLLPSAKGINNTSGGIGKKEASAKEIPARAFGPEGLSAHPNTQSYI